jgi:hypothetical protein
MVNGECYCFWYMCMYYVFMVVGYYSMYKHRVILGNFESVTVIVDFLFAKLCTVIGAVSGLTDV